MGAFLFAIESKLKKKTDTKMFEEIFVNNFSWIRIIYILVF